MRVSIFVGDITDVQVDALCTSTNPRLSLVLGTGAAVRGRGGYEILRACEEIVRMEGILPPGSARATTAGSLPYKVVIHCVASDARHQSSDLIVETCVRNALSCADASGCRSVAMPVFASGHASFKFRRSLEVMARTLRDSASAIDHVALVVYDPEQADEAHATVCGVMRREVPIVRSRISVSAPSSWWSDDSDRFI